MSNDYDDKVANFIWGLEDKLVGHLPPLVAKLTYFHRSSVLPDFHEFESQVSTLMVSKEITADLGYNFITEAYQWLAEQKK